MDLVFTSSPLCHRLASGPHVLLPAMAQMDLPLSPLLHLLRTASAQSNAIVLRVPDGVWLAGPPVRISIPVLSRILITTMVPVSNSFPSLPPRVGELIVLPSLSGALFERGFTDKVANVTLRYIVARSTGTARDNSVCSGNMETLVLPAPGNEILITAAMQSRCLSVRVALVDPLQKYAFADNIDDWILPPQRIRQQNNVVPLRLTQVSWMPRWTDLSKSTSDVTFTDTFLRSSYATVPLDSNGRFYLQLSSNVWDGGPGCSNINTFDFKDSETVYYLPYRRTCFMSKLELCL